MELKEIIEGCIINKSASQKAFFKIYYGRLMAVSLRMSPNRETAEDLLQDAFIKIYKHLNELNNYASPVVYTWCKRILTNLIIDYYRRNKNIEISFYDNFDVEIDDDTDYLESKNVDAESIILALQTLPPKYSLAFNLYVIEGYTHQEISEKLNINIGTSKSNLFKAKEKLRKELQLC